MIEDDKEEESSSEDIRPKSELSQMIDRLKSAAFKTAKEREKIPQPLFWSLFNSELKDIKKAKSVRRTLDELLKDIS